MTPSEPKHGPTLEAHLRSATAQAEAAWAVISDRRARPADALPLLDLGFRRLAAGLGSTGSAEAPFAALLEGPIPGLDAASRPRLAAALARLTEVMRTLPDADPNPPPGRADLSFLASTLAGCARAGRLAAAGPRSAVRRFAAPSAAVLALGLAVGAVAMPRHTQSTGWSGSYFPNEHLQGPAKHRRDPTLSFFWDHGGPFDDFPTDHFSARWVGCLRTTRAGKATFAIGSDDGSRLFIDGKPVIDAWHSQAMVFHSTTVSLEPGVHSIRVDYVELSGDAGVMLKLGWDGQEPRPLSRWSILYPGASPSEKNPCASVR